MDAVDFGRRRLAGARERSEATWTAIEKQGSKANEVWEVE